MSCMKIDSSYKFYSMVEFRIKGLRRIHEFHVSSETTGFLYWGTQSGISGAGVFFRINDEHLFRLKMNCGRGSNTKYELLYISCLSKFASTLGIDILKIYGDSLVIVNWEKKSFSLHVISLFRWCWRIEYLLASFHVMNIDHIFREHNTNADSISKEALGEEEGFIHL